MPARVVLVLFCLVASVVNLATLSVSAQTSTCADYDAWVWAQTVYDRDPASHAALDPDGNGIACEDLPVSGAFAPVLWTDAIPAGAEPVTVTNIVDGDTFDIIDASGQTDRVRMYHIDAPETTNAGGGPHCGGDTATAFLAMLISYAPGGTVYLEYDQTQRDRFDRRLAYVWFQIDGDVYLLNEAMVRNGYAESETYKPDTKYQERLNTAEQWSVEKVTGVRLECGRFGQAPETGPSNEQVAQAHRRQPNQGQLPPFPGSEPSPLPTEPPQAAPTEGQVPYQPPATETEMPWVPTEEPWVPTEVPTESAGGDCDPSYPTVCIPPIWVSGDLDCGDISYRRFQVVPPDPHNFDGDFDGIGCESG